MVRKGENIYQRKDGRWEGRYIKSRNAENRIVYGYIYGKKYLDVKNELLQYKSFFSSKTKTIEFQKDSYVRWLVNDFYPSLAPRLKQSTDSNYRRLIERHIIPYFENVHFDEIDGDCLQNFITKLYSEGRSTSTIRLIFSIVRQSIKEAQRLGYISDNPLDWLKFPKEKPRTIKALTLVQQQELEQIAIHNKYGLPILISLYAGLRIGEISGLTWQDIDFDENLIFVNKTVSRVTNAVNENKTKTTVIIDSPKTNDSNRRVPLSNTLKDILHKEYLTRSSDFVIATVNGLAEPRTINYRFKQLIKDTSFSEIHFHVLRHTFATRAIEFGMDIVSLSKILGHKSTQLTLDTYSDSLFEQRRKEIMKIDQVSNLFRHNLKAPL